MRIQLVRTVFGHRIPAHTPVRGCGCNEEALKGYAVSLPLCLSSLVNHQRACLFPADRQQRNMVSRIREKYLKASFCFVSLPSLVPSPVFFFFSWKNLMVTRCDGTCENFGNLPYSPDTLGQLGRLEPWRLTGSPLDSNIDGRENEMVVTF